MFRTRTSLEWLALALTLHLGVVASEYFKPFNVSYDHRALIINGKRRMLISAGIHYLRATPEMWPDLIAKSKEGGANVIQTYAFWNGHEPVRGEIEFASYGTPRGSCQMFSIGNCHAPNSSSVVSKACQGRNSCKIKVSNSVFGDPCRGTVKTLSVEATCGSSSSLSSYGQSSHVRRTTASNGRSLWP